MEEPVFQDLQDTINVITLLIARVKEFKKNIKFFNENWEEASKDTETMARELFIEGLRHLGHDVMFLCIDAYSLHRGISKRKSLFSKSIKQNAKRLSIVDKSASFSKENYHEVGEFGSNGKRSSSEEEINESIKQANIRYIEHRTKLRDSSGFSTSNHEELNKWLESVTEDEVFTKLGEYRDQFAHRLDNLHGIKDEIKLFTPQYLSKAIETVEKAMTIYKKRLTDLIVYTCSVYYDGLSTIYDSLPRLKTFREMNAHYEQLKKLESL